MSRAHLAHAGRVEAVGRLVEDEQLRVLEQRRGDAEPLLHAQRVRRRSGRRRARARPTVLERRAMRCAGDAPACARARAGCPGRTGTGRSAAASTSAPTRASAAGVPGRRARARRRCRASAGPGRAASAASSSCRRRSGRGSRRPRRGARAGRAVDREDRLAVALGEVAGLDHELVLGHRNRLPTALSRACQTQRCGVPSGASRGRTCL